MNAVAMRKAPEPLRPGPPTSGWATEVLVFLEGGRHRIMAQVTCGSSNRACLWLVPESRGNTLPSSALNGRTQVPSLLV